MDYEKSILDEAPDIGSNKPVAQWSEITPLNTELPPVDAFSYGLLPDGIADWVADIVARMQCPPDFVAVTVMVALASLIGRKVVIYPKKNDDWQVTCNLWGALIGRPSSKKTPAMTEGLKPLKRLAIAAREVHQMAEKEHKIDQVFSKQNAVILEGDVKKALKSKDKTKIDAARNDWELQISDDQESPTEQRYIVNDPTVEKLGELLNQNPNGLLFERDELTGWLKGLDREDRANDRAFYLEAFNGAGNYTYDRIGRGTVHIENMTLSLIGCIQPSRLGPYIYQAINGGDGDDGLIQRLQLAVYPDDCKEWRNVDRWPNEAAKDKAFSIFQQINDAEPMTDDEGNPQAVRFTQDAQQIFNEWREALERKTREPGIHPAIESHFVKYSSLMPSLALIINEVEQGHYQSVTAQSVRKAAAWCEYLESHALRIYGGAIDPAAQGAKTILSRRENLPTVFKVRDIQRKGWTGLSTNEHVKDAVKELVECGYIRAMNEKNPTGGRPLSCSHEWNPNIEKR